MAIEQTTGLFALITLLVITEGWDIKSDETRFVWKPCANEISEPAVDEWKTCTPVGQVVTKKIETEKLPTETKLVNHEKLQLSGQNIILSSLNSKPVHHPPNAESKQQCNRCKKNYTTNSALVKHQRYYCNLYQKKSFTCKHCDKVYVSLGALKMHIRTHTLPCRCKICGKAFSRPWLLQGHIRTHTGEKPYQCSNCARAFADRSNLRAHLQTHSDIKKYKCERCNKTFSRMSLLLKHQSTGCSAINL